MPKLTIYPLGNADCSRIDLDGGKKILLDYANCKSDDQADLRIDLPVELRRDLKLAKRNSYDVVAFTHLDDDHICKASEFFWLQHAAKYQGGDRIKIDEMWVPAAAITEDNACDESKIIQAEARDRLKRKQNIRVFSRPDRLKDWLKKNGMTVDEVKHLITDAGQTIPGFAKDKEGVEFFVHSPFAKRLNETEVEDRNLDSLVFQGTFLTSGVETKILFTADTPHEAWVDIVNITRFKKREERLEWDVLKLPHHCSYLSLGPDRGEEKTDPVENVKWLHEKANGGAIIVSSSKPIPEKGSEEDKGSQPPHRQAKNFYVERRDKLNGEFVVTMEHPSKKEPKPLVIMIGAGKATIDKSAGTGIAAAASQIAPRAGER